MKTTKSWITALLLTLPLAACQSLSPLEEQQYENLIAQGAEPLTPKSPLAAALLNIGPGFGDLYNLRNWGPGNQWGAFTLDFLLWYLSPIWAIPQAAVTANNINKRATLTYYTIGDGAGAGYDPNRP